MLEFFLDLLFPPVCGFCGKINKNSLCDVCEDKLNPQLIYGINTFKEKYFTKQIYIMNYKGEIREKILSYKFKNKSYMYKTFTRIIFINEKICDILKKYDIIMEVPIHKKRKMQRGYDQSELIAKEIAKTIEKLKYLKALKKVKNNSKQSSLKKLNRIENVKNAYEITKKEIICNKRIILFDDIYTTGATVNECAKVLKENHAKEILVLTLAK